MEENKELLNQEQENLNKESISDNVPDFESEIRALRENRLYSDIDKVSDEISAFASEKGISAKEAYNALFGEARANKLLAEVQKIKDDFHKKSRKKFVLNY